MAELHAVPIWYGYFRFQDTRSNEPFGYADGKYAGVALSEQSFTPYEERLRLRPTGNTGSGPYFNAYKSGAYGVRSASVLKTEGGTHPYAGLMNWTKDFTIEEGSHAIRVVSRVYCDGHTAVAYNIGATKAGMHYATFNAFKLAGSTSGLGRIAIKTYSNDSTSLTNYASIDMIVAKYEYFLWNVLSSGDYVDPEISVGLDTKRFRVCAGVESDPTDQRPLAFDHDELYSFEWWDLTGDMPGIYRELGGEAYYTACEGLPKSFNNSIANILELASTLADVLHGNFGKLIPRNPRDAWLFYRYQYTTTKLDISEYAELTRNLAAVAAMDSIRSDGVAKKDGITCHCYVEVDPGDIIPEETRSWLKSYGVKLTAYDVWDMIPFSFVADWFLHIGDFLETMERENWAYSLTIKDAWTSYKTYGPGTQTTYLRVPGYFRAKCPFLSYSSTSASGKTIVKRFADTIALFA